MVFRYDIERRESSCGDYWADTEHYHEVGGRHGGGAFGGSCVKIVGSNYNNVFQCLRLGGIN